MQFHPPTGVTHCVDAYFTHASGEDNKLAAPNLIVVKATRLEIYTLRCA